jgi:hypothetical protein
MSARRYTLFILAFVLILVLWMSVATVVLSPYRLAHIIKAGAPDAPALIPTPTPFRPVANRPAEASEQVDTQYQPQQTPQVLSWRPPPTREPASHSLSFYGVNFADRDKRVRITIFPPNKQVNQGKPIVIAFVPGENCEFGNQLACVNAYLTETGSQAIFLTIHSGIGGQAEIFRSALEGTAFNQPAFSLSKVQNNLLALQGAQVEIKQGEMILTNLILRVVARIPSTNVNQYIRSSADQALDIASDLDPDISTLIDPAEPQLVFETCGWKMPEEPWAKSVTTTSGSIYLVVIQKSNPQDQESTSNNPNRIP